MPTLAVLLIVIDGVPFADVWRRWADTRAPPGWAVRFLIHAKDRRAVLADRTQPPWVHASLLPVSFRPEWGSVELVRAALELVHVALEDASVQWLTLASESCVPVVPLDTAIAALASEGRSWLHYDIPRSRYDSERYRAIDQRASVVPTKAICKSDQWFCMTRADAQAVADLPRTLLPDDAEPALWHAFSAAVASDEWYFSTCLSVLGLINLDALKAEERQRQEAQRRMELYGIKPRAGGATAPPAAADTSTVLRRRLTYRHWPVPSSPSPEFLEFSPATVHAAVAAGCLFARKFRAFPVDAWTRVVLGG